MIIVLFIVLIISIGLATCEALVTLIKDFNLNFIPSLLISMILPISVIVLILLQIKI